MRMYVTAYILSYLRTCIAHVKSPSKSKTSLTFGDMLPFRHKTLHRPIYMDKQYLFTTLVEKTHMN